MHKGIREWSVGGWGSLGFSSQFAVCSQQFAGSMLQVRIFQILFTFYQQGAWDCMVQTMLVLHGLMLVL